MFKKIIFGSFALGIITLVSCSETKSTDTAEKKETTVAPTATPVMDSQMKVAYVNSDSLFAKYDLYKDLEEEFIEERVVAENAMKSKIQQLEKDYQDAQAGASQLSEEALQILGAKLQQREQQLMGEKQQMEAQLMQSEQAKNDKLYEELRKFLDDYAASNGYHMIYAYSGYGDVLYMAPEFDITAQVIDALNTEYASSQVAEIPGE